MNKTPLVLSPFEGQLFAESEKVLEAANQKGIVLRLLGALAIRSHCNEFAYIHEKAARKLSDLDMAAYLRHRSHITRLFRDIGYKDSSLATIPGLKRSVFFGEGELHVDVFYDGLEMSHDIPFQNRLEADYPTIPLSELVLEKMQIVEINEKDLIDTAMLMLEHKVGEGDEETVNASRIAELCSNDWGLWKTATLNLRKVSDYARSFPVLDENAKKQLDDKIRLLLTKLDEQPKSMKWRMRARIGERRPWYRTVEER